MEELLRHSRLAHEFVEAVDGALLTAEERARLVDAEAVARYPHWLTPGIVGSSLSHLEAYDQVLPEDFGELLTEIESLVAAAEAVLLYYRSHVPARFSEPDAVPLKASRSLRYPVDVEPITCAGAYVITREACLNMLETAMPIRLGPDSWNAFYEEGALHRLRCIVPRPVGVRTDFKSTIDYLGNDASLVQRVMTGISERRPFPFYNLVAWRRSLVERRMSRFEVVAERSPMADANAAE
jgi:hypothetical protein